MGNQISQTAALVEAAAVKEEQQEVQQQGTATSPMESRNESSPAQEDMICETPLTVEVESDASVVVEEEESPESKQNTETTTASSTPSVLSSVASSSSCGVTLLQSLFPRPTPFVPLSEFASPLRDSDDDDEDHDEDASYTTLPCAPAYWTSPKSDATEAATASTSPTNSSTPTLFRSASLTSFFTQQLEYTPQEMLLSETRPVPVSDLSRPRPVWIVTTAALPWMTGTAVNPLLRAACLWETYYKQQQEESTRDENNASEDEQQQTTPIEPDVHVVLPWLEVADDRVKVYGADWADATPAKQEAYLRTWMRETANYPKASRSIQIHFYPARYHPSLMSIFCMGDLCDYVADLQPAPNAVCLLEEPEHLNYYRAPTERGSVWQKVFGHVVGILHTNYRFYAAQHNVLAGPLVGAISAWMVQAYCDKVIKLSAVLQEYAPEKEVVANVHGIRSGFLQAVQPDAEGKIYFVGKLLWAKGLDRLLDLQAYYRRQRGDYFAMDIYGSGPEQEEIRKAFLGTGEATSTTSSSASTTSTTTSTTSSWSAAFRASTPLPVTFPGRLDHAAIGPDYKIFLNPSLSEVLCTTTAEALAMGKFVIIPKHSSNTFFEDFTNCRSYSSKQEFVAAVDFCLTHAPQPLSDKERYTLTWEAATARLVAAAQVSERDAARRERIRRKHGDDSATTEQRIAALHYALGKGRTGDVLRKVLGGGPVAEQFQYHHLSSSSLKEESKQQSQEEDTIGLVTVQTAA